MIVTVSDGFVGVVDQIRIVCDSDKIRQEGRSGSLMRERRIVNHRADVKKASIKHIRCLMNERERRSANCCKERRGLHGICTWLHRANNHFTVHLVISAPSFNLTASQRQAYHSNTHPHRWTQMKKHLKICIHVYKLLRTRPKLEKKEEKKKGGAINRIRASELSLFHSAPPICIAMRTSFN